MANYEVMLTLRRRAAQARFAAANRALTVARARAAAGDSHDRELELQAAEQVQAARRELAMLSDETINSQEGT